MPSQRPVSGRGDHPFRAIALTARRQPRPLCSRSRFVDLAPTESGGGTRPAGRLHRAGSVVGVRGALCRSTAAMWLAAAGFAGPAPLATTGSASANGPSGCGGPPSVTSQPQRRAAGASGGLSQSAQPVTPAAVEGLRSVTRARLATLRQIDEDLLAAASRLREAEDHLVEVAAEMQALEVQLGRQREAVNRQAAAYGVHLRALYKFQRFSPLEQFLSARDFGELLHRAALMRAVVAVDQQRLRQFRADHEALLAAQQRLEEKEREAALLRETVAREQAALAERRADLAAASEQARQEQWEAETALFLTQERASAAAIAALQAQYHRELDALGRQRAAEAATPPAGRAAPAPLPVLAWPVLSPVVTTEFGEPTFAQSAHTGIDLAQRRLAPVLAAADGVVMACGLAVPGAPEQSYGMRVVIGHTPALATLYAHLDDEAAPPPVVPGQVVRRGQVIGFIGVTGLTSGPHLHFEVRSAGQSRDPRHHLPG